MFDIRPSGLPGCFEIRPRVASDARGRFVKTFHESEFRAAGLETDFKEEYYSVSKAGVIRGMHFQLPPHDHVKVVYCVAGTVVDVVVDLRRNSPTFGRAVRFELSAEAANYLYIPRGMAHGFCVPEGEATLVYKVSTVYAPHHDAGIRWDSVEFDWPFAEPIVSDRDKMLPPLGEFVSPFIYEPTS